MVPLVSIVVKSRSTCVPLWCSLLRMSVSMSVSLLAVWQVTVFLFVTSAIVFHRDNSQLVCYSTCGLLQG